MSVKRWTADMAIYVMAVLSAAAEIQIWWQKIQEKTRRA